MAEWTDKVLPEPDEKYVPKVKITNNYGDYGFYESGALYTLQEERRDFRKDIQYEIKAEHVNTQNTLGHYINQETDEVEQKLQEHDTDVKEQIQQHDTDVKELIAEVKSDTASIKTTVANVYNILTNDSINSVVKTIKDNTETIKSTTNNIWDKIKYWNWP